MSKSHSSSPAGMLLTLLTGVVLALAGLVYFAGYYKPLTIAAGLVCVYLLLFRSLKPLRTVPAALLMAYVVFSGMTLFWAISGKFFLSEFSEIFVAATLFLAVMLTRRFDRTTARNVMAMLVSAASVYSILSVEAASTGLSKRLLHTLMPSFQYISVDFEAGTRLTGILGNANLLSTALAVGILFSLCLLCGEEHEKMRPVWAAMAAVNAFVFLLLFSMGGTACFVLAVLVYLLFAGQSRGSALVRMLEVALPTLLWVFAAFPCFNRGGAAALVPLAALVGDVICVVLLERLLAPRLIQTLAQRGKLVTGILAGVLVLAGVYIALGVNVTGAYTFGGEALERSAYPAAGEHTLSMQASGAVEVTVVSQNMSQVMMHTNTVLYQGDARDAAFTVPEDSEVCYFTFTAESGTVLERAQLSSGESLKLNYVLLPGFIANRLQGLWANQNAIQRTVFFRDGMKMFRQSPIVGNGVGSFGTGISSVQDFFYETKYIHNHYIQVLLESGIVGFIPFVGALLGMAVLLWKRRGDHDAFGAEYPALWAALVMLASHMAFEVSMSVSVPLFFAYVTFALVIRCCRMQPEPELPAEKSKKAPAKVENKGRKWLSKAWAVLPAVFVFSICFNMGVEKLYAQPVHSAGEFLSHLELGAKLDLYEKNDAKLSYVMMVYRQGLEEYQPQANELAQELLAQQSNSIPNALLSYYLHTGQYDQALQAAKAAATYSASSHKVWNQVIDQYREHFIENPDSPLLTGDTRALTDGILEYYQMLLERNANSMEEIALSEENADFFQRMQTLAESDMSRDAVERVLDLEE